MNVWGLVQPLVLVPSPNLQQSRLGDSCAAFEMLLLRGGGAAGALHGEGDGSVATASVWSSLLAALAAPCCPLSPPWNSTITYPSEAVSGGKLQLLNCIAQISP